MTLRHNVVSQRFFGECFSSEILAIILVISSVAHDTFATQRNAKLLQNSAQRHRHICPQIHEQLMLAAHDNVLVRVMFVLALSLDLCFYVVRCCFCFILAEISRESGKAVHWTWSTLNLKGINPIANINFIDLKIFSSAFMIISFFFSVLSLDSLGEAEASKHPWIVIAAAVNSGREKSSALLWIMQCRTSNIYVRFGADFSLIFVPLINQSFVRAVTEREGGIGLSTLFIGSWRCQFSAKKINNIIEQHNSMKLTSKHFETTLIFPAWKALPVSPFLTRFMSGCVEFIAPFHLQFVATRRCLFWIASNRQSSWSASDYAMQNVQHIHTQRNINQ